ncbi:MAG: hypothetical protein ACYC5Y_06575 [Symbiobacteriia bacterium]
MRYELRLSGRLPRDWADWFDGFRCVLTEAGETVLTGSVADQAALLGLLGSVSRLNLTLLSVRRLD